MISQVLSRLSPKEFAKYIDSTLLNVDATMDVVLNRIEEAKEYGFKCVVLSPYHTLYVLSNKLADGVDICSVVGFPLGFTPTKAKTLEAEELLVHGVKELDIVMNLQAFKSGRYDEVLNDLVAVIDIVKRYGAVAKVIIESPLLTYVEKMKAVELVIETGAHFIKTSTGVLTKTDLGDVYTLVKLAKGRIKIKASGGFRNVIDVLIAIAMGVQRIGTSTASQIYQEFLRLQAKP